MGNIYDLHAAMQLNPALKQAVENYINLSSDERKNTIKNLIYKWVNVENNPLKGRGSMSDARELNVYEAIMGATFVHRSQGKNPNSTVSNYLHELYMIFQNYVYASLELQTTYKGLIDTEYMVLKDNGALEYDFTNFNATMKELYNAEKYEKIVAIKELLTQASAYKPKLAMQLFSNLQMLGLENEYFYKIIADNVLLAKADGGNLSGSSAADHITGSDNVDKIYAGSGNDTIIGRAGDDYIDGGAGNDIYIYNKGDGADTILDGSGSDIIKLGDGFSKDDILAVRSGNDLKILFKNSPNDSILIKNGVINASYVIEKLLFDNGDILTIDELRAMTLIGDDGNDTINGYSDRNNIIYGNGGDDKLIGSSGNDTLYGNEGNDKLYGNEGNDTLNGGSGDDILEGGNGDDTYVFNLGDGNDTILESAGTDTIKFGAGIKLDDLIAYRYHQSTYDSFGLKIDIKNTNDSIFIKYLYSSNKHYVPYTIENFEFADGTKLTLKEFESLVAYKGTDGNNTINGLDETDDTIYGNGGDDYLYGNGGNDTIYGGSGKDNIKGGNEDDMLYGNEDNDELYGESGNDTLYGNEGNDTLNGGSGDDILEGGNGDDTYVFNLGDGNDTILESAGTDTIKFGAGIDKEKITFKRISSDLSLKYEDNNIKISNYFSNNSYKIEKIELENGEFITSTQINKIIEQLNTYANDNGLTSITHDDIASNQNLMQLVMSGWGN